MLLLHLLALLPLALGAAFLPRDGAESYEGFQTFRIDAEGKADNVLKMLKGNVKYDRWSHDSKHVDIAVPPSDLEKFKKLGLKWEQMHQDLGAAIKEESASHAFAVESVNAQGLPADSWFDAYHAYADHVNYWKQLNTAFPNNSQYFVAGKSVEGRDIFGLKLFGSKTSGKPAVIWHSNVHAREWITSITVEYIAQSIISGYMNNAAVYKAILDKFDIYILPFVNPDGFVYSQTTNRLWRKNRSPAPKGSGLLKDLAAAACLGTDVNRNWPYMWNGAGSSTDPCDETYRGSSAGDTPENKALVSQMQSVAKSQKIALYIDFHSYSQDILTPYGYTCNMLPANSASQVSLGQKAAAAIRSVHGTQYTVGPTCQTLYATAGGSNDYAQDVAKAQYAFAIELRDTGRYGFVLPPNQIRPSGEETLEGVKAALAGL